MADLRWSGGSIDRAATLRAIGIFPGYWIVLLDRNIATAPDDRNRALAAVFTSEAARDLFLEDLAQTSAPNLHLKVTARVNGRDLFERLQAMTLDGIVFNCMGPDRPIAFVPRLSQDILDALDRPGAIDFDALTRAAFPGNEPGPIPAMNSLWNACFALSEWVILADPKSVTRPFTTVEAGYPCLFAFTDSSRARRFAAENALLADNGDAILIVMSPASALEWTESAPGADSLRLHFNFGGPGWYSPVKDLRRIRTYAQEHPN